MTSKHLDLITLPKMLGRLPSLALKLPKIVRGLRYATNENTEVHTGLGFTFAKVVKANPTGIAIKFEDMQLTYQQLDEWSNQLANYFISLGLTKGDVVGVALENRPEMLCASLAAAKTGTVVALINTSQTGKVLIHSLNLVKPKMLIIGAELAEAFQAVRADLNVPDESYFWWDDIDNYNHKDDTNPTPDGMTSIGPAIHKHSIECPITSTNIFLKDPLFYLFTSGTTGMPKAVVINHGRWMKAYGFFGHFFNLNKNDTLYVTLPLYHATAMIVCWSCVIAGGGSFALQRKFSASNFWHDIKKFEATSFGYVGELCRYLIDTPTGEHETGNRVTKVIGNGLRPSIWNDFKTRFAINEVLEIYGASESNIGFSNLLNFNNTVGLCPVPFKIVAYDQETDEPIRNKDGFMTVIGRGETGLLLGEINDKTPFDGYTDKDKTQEKILRDVFIKGDAYFNTGDIMRDIGYKHTQFVDRVGDTFRWKGENVSTTEVESIIAELSGISEAIVYGVEIVGTNGRAGMVAITLEDGVTFDSSFQKSFLLQLDKHLPSYAIPIFIRHLKTIETTGTFKYKKNNLKDISFNPEKTDDEIWVHLPNEEKFTAVDSAQYQRIQSSHYRF